MSKNSVNTKNFKDFITSFERKRNEIIIYYANGEEKIIPYSLFAERDLLESKEKQTNRLDNIENNIKKERLSGELAFYISEGVSIAFMVATFATPFWKEFLMGLGVTQALALISGGIYLSADNKINKLKKLNIFLSSSDAINSELRKNNDLTKVISQSAKATINKGMQTSSDPININNLDNLSLKDLKALKEEINNTYGNESVIENDIDKIKTKTKTIR